MKNTQYYIDMFRDIVLNDILNAPTDESTIDYLSDCLKQAYETVLDTIRAEAK